MNNKKLIKIFKELDDRIYRLTFDDIENLTAGDGLYSILEQSIDAVITNKEDNDLFWANYQSTTYDGTPKEHYIDYMLIEKHFNALLNAQYRKLRLERIDTIIDNMKRDIITNIGDDCVWIDHILEIRELI